nr:hypothetical protein [Tanacetum cinerariifolium]
NDLEEIARVLTSMDAATVLAGGIDVPTSSVSIPTTGPFATDISTGSEVAPTASPIVTSYSIRKGKEVMVQYSRRARIAQSFALPTIADEPASPMRDVSKGEACPTESGFIVDQDRATIAKSSTLPHDSAPRVTSPLLMRAIRTGQPLLNKSGDDAPIKGRSSNEGEAAAKGVSNDSEDISRVLTSMDAATVLAGEANVPTGSGFIRMNEQIDRDVEVARIHAEEEIQGMIDSLDKSNETVAKYLQEYQQFASDLSLEKKIELISDLVKYQEHYTKVYKFQSQQRKPMSKKQKREYYMAVIKSYLGWRFNDFKEEAPESKTPTKEVSEDKIKEMMQLVPVEDVQLDREDLNQLWALVKEYLYIRPASNDKEMELWVELKRMYEPDPKDQLWTLTQNYMHAPVEWKLYDLS